MQNYASLRRFGRRVRFCREESNKCFGLNAMPAPPHIQKLIDEIKHSKDRWIALYTSTWTYQAINSLRQVSPLWEKHVIVGLPAREHRGRIYQFRTAEDLDRILRSRDGEIALNHTVTLFSLLEKLAKEVYKHKNGPLICFI